MGEVRRVFGNVVRNWQARKLTTARVSVGHDTHGEFVLGAHKKCQQTKLRLYKLSH